MKLLLLLALAAVVFANPQIVSIVNSNPTSTWVAGVNPRFVGMTHEELRSLLGLKLDFINLPKKVEENANLPDTFDVREQWPGCPSYSIRDQGRCGSCWAFGAAEALSDRFCISQNKKVVLSPQWLVSCDKSNMACNGGWLDKVWRFMASTGVVEDSCMKYVSGRAGQVPPCPSQCEDGSALKMYKAANAYDVSSSEQAIMSEIQQYGSVEVGFSVYSDFMSYRSGIYHHQTGYLQGGHAVKMIGWGVENGQKYWLVANSWGTSWGESGHFRIRRGVNECNIESMVTAGQAGTSEGDSNNKCSNCKSALKIVIGVVETAACDGLCSYLGPLAGACSIACHKIVNKECSAHDCITEACELMHFC
ncbi:hypothetical protein GEMRC1_007179 [Eukaryota sp. GEM-RC1]